MKRSAFAAVFAVLFSVSNIVAQSSNPPSTPDSVRDDKAKPAQQDPGTRKLSRRERKDRMSKLPEKYRQFLEDVEPIILPNEVDTFLILETDAQRDIYINDFWKRRDAAQGTTNHAFRDLYYERLETAKSQYKQASCDRARTYLLYGEPMEVLKIDCDRLLQPIEIWHYFYIPSISHHVRLLFYIPRMGNDYKLFRPMGDNMTDLAELVSQEAMGGAINADAAVQKVFFQSEFQGSFLSKIETQCKNGDEILRAISASQQNRTLLLNVFDPPKVNDEDVKRILRSVVIATPNAPKLAADFAVKFPAKQGAKTDAEITVSVPRSQVVLKDVGGVKLYSLDVTGEVLREGQLYENYRYRYDYPADVKDEKLPVVIDRFLRPAEYQSRIKVTDVNSGAEAILENAVTVPELFDTPEQQKAKEAGEKTIAQLKEDVQSNETKLRIVPFADELLSGIQKIETLAVGDNIKAVVFYLDGKKVAIKRQPPFTLDLDFGSVPQVHKVRVVAVDEKGTAVAGDDVAVNTGNDPFRVRIVSPRIGNVKGRTRVEVAVKVPEGKSVGAVQLYLNETPMATLYDAPYVSTVNIPATQSVGYLRAVATLKDDPTPPVEDVVMINTPAYMETVDVHLIELPTTVLVSGHPKTDLGEASFKVFDEGKPVKISKFEYVKNLPLSLGLAIDTSGSMQPRMQEAQKAGAQFFQNVLKAGDKAFVVSFDTQPQLIQKWSPRLSDLNAGLAKLRAEEYTALYDAVVFSLYNFLGVKGQKALVLITDGKDTVSKFSYDQALEYSRRAAVPIYGIGIGIKSSEIDVRYKFGKFCTETGGNVYYIDRAEELGRIYTDIQNELRSQYVLGFYPPDGVKPGSKWREVTVQVSEGRAKTIRGYYP
ncbi:MAG TPA: VWA domain-containing protein [Thermoanaerobaculia bacterium]|nr:VWA domain-containing protein [Thermoanaerobaculia bacterium]